MQHSQSNNSRIAKNTCFLYIRMFFVLVVNLYISRVLLGVLGVSDYGTYVVVAGFVTLFGFFNATLSSTMQRYYNYAGTTNSKNGLQEVFSTGCVIHIVVASVTLLLLETFGLWYFYHFLVIPACRFNAALLVFHASVISLILLMLEMPFIGLILSQERMGFYSFVSIVDIVLKLVITLSISHLPFDSLECYGLLLMCVSFVDLCFYSIYCKVNWRYIHLSKKINRKLCRSLLSFTGWNLIGTFAFMLKGQGISLLLNNFFGPIVNAARGIAMQVSNAIQNFSSNISVAFSPQIVNSVAAEDFKRAENLMFTESKICYSLLLIIATPLCLEMDYVLKLWLGKHTPFQSNIFSILMIADALICTLNTPITQLTMATGKVERYQMGSTFINLLLIPTCLFLLYLHFSAISSFVITIVFSIINQIVCCALSHKVFQFSLFRYFKTVIFPCFTLTIVLPIIPTIIYFSFESSFWRLMIISLVVLLCAFPYFFIFILNKQEKEIVKHLIHNKMKSYHTEP